jgi:CubicO group peptidase (beta-lactamase class C family)
VLRREQREQLQAVARGEGVNAVHALCIQGDAAWELAVDACPDRSGFDPRVLYPLWSATKPFTAMLVASLAAAGELGFDAPINTIIAVGPGLLSNVTIRDLLSHQTALPPLIGDAWTSLAERIAAAAGATARSAGPLLNYQSFHYLLVGYLAQEATRTPFEALLARYILHPAGAHGASVRPAGLVPEGRLIQPTGTVPLPREYLCENAAAHGLHLTPEAMAALLRWTLQTVPQLDAATKFLTPRATAAGSLLFRVSHPFVDEVSYTSGWWREVYAGHVFYHHPGLGSGGESAIGFCPELDAAYVIFSDTQHGPRAQTNAIQCTRWAIYAHLCGTSPPSFPAAAKGRASLMRSVFAGSSGSARTALAADEARALCGLYAAGDRHAIEIGIENGQAYVDFSDPRLKRRWLFGSTEDCVGRLLPRQEIDITGPATPSIVFESADTARTVAVQGRRYDRHA